MDIGFGRVLSNRAGGPRQCVVAYFGELDEEVRLESNISIRNRCVSRPTGHQAILLQLLGLEIQADEN